MSEPRTENLTKKIKLKFSKGLRKDHDVKIKLGFV